MKKIAYVIRHVAFEDLGSWENIINQEYTIKYFDAGYDDLNEIKINNPNLLIILGGPIGVYDYVDYPFLLLEQEIIKHRIESNLPTLGICLGAQLIASSMGASIYKGALPEIGWSSLSLLSNGSNNCLNHFANKEIKVLHWHGDTFDLPKNAVLLASTDLYPNQAFSFGNNVLALQFHPEVTQLGMEKWFIGHSLEIAQNKIDLRKFRQDTRLYSEMLVKSSKLFLQDWLKNLK